MRRPALRFVRHLACGLLGAVLAAGWSVAFAQPVIDAVLSDAQLLVRKDCEILKVNFNVRIRYAHHFPIDFGNDLRISLNAIDRDQLVSMQLLKREAVRVPYNNNAKLAPLLTIDFETLPAIGPLLKITFARPVYYKVAQSSDIQSVIVAISGSKANPACRPELPPGAVGAQAVVFPREHPLDSTSIRPKERPAGKISDADLRIVAASMDEAREALQKQNFKGAIVLLIKALNYPENEYSAEGEELLGLAYQKSGQPTAAKAEYEDYLRRYPNGEGSERVKQRLDGIITASGEPLDKLRTVPDQVVNKAPNGQFLRSGDTTWILSGSLSAFYIRDDSFQQKVDPSVAPNVNEDADAHQVHQNEFLTSLDLFASWNNDATKGKIRFSGTAENGLGTGEGNHFGVAALFSEVEIKDWNVLTRVGRQVRTNDGVLGRFDGALVSWQALPFVRFNLVGGSPVLSRYDDPFKDDRWFAGPSVDFGPFFGGFEASLYAIEQRDQWILDREAVGTELRYFDPSKTAFTTVEYDVHFQELNAAIFSGSWTLEDKSTIYGGADYRKTPFLSTWNALLNQPFATVYDMLKVQSLEQLQQLAVDETPTYKSAMLGYSRPITDHFQISGDATVVNLTQPIDSSAVDPGLPNLPAGNEYYYSTQFMFNNILKDGDLYMVGLRYSQLLDSNMYVVDVNTRFPWNTDLSFSPRVRLGYRAGREGLDLQEYTMLPSLLVDYRLNKEWSFEGEIGWEQIWSKQAGVPNNNGDLYLTLGARYDFYADDGTKERNQRTLPTPAAAALCRYSTGASTGNCAVSPTSMALH